MEEGLSYKKIENPKIGYICFFVSPYFEPFGSHATSNFSIYRYVVTFAYKLSSHTKIVFHPETTPSIEYPTDATPSFERAISN